MSPAGGGMTTLETPISAPLLLPAELRLSPALVVELASGEVIKAPAACQPCAAR